ncbi:MAG: ATP-binding cassette domain-containing protein, partial [Desulfarculus sp.]|nr:ATP-binding cassette domain-containing protein [Desulfarculus sp.]
MSFIIGQDLAKTYGAGEAAMTALKGVDFSIDRGEFVAVMGPSGSGKSTLLSILGALNTPSRGSFLVDGLDIYQLGNDQRADFRREYLGFVFQSFNLVPYLSLQENVMLPLATQRMSA